MLKNLIPKVFYDHLDDGLEFFEASLGFEVLYQDANTVRLKPWGAREFAMLDKTTVCVVFRQWPVADNPVRAA